MAGAARQVSLKQLAGEFGSMARQLGGISFRVPLKQCAVAIAAETKKNFAEGRTPSGQPWKPLAGFRVRGGDKPLRDRGLLMASVTAQGLGHIERIDKTKLVYGTNVDYAATHQYGATITPTKGKYLAIPLTREAYRAGSPRAFAGDLTFIKRRGSRSALLADTAKAKRGRSFTAHYLLVPQVKIPARKFLGLNDRIITTCERILARWFREQIA